MAKLATGAVSFSILSVHYRMQTLLSPSLQGLKCMVNICEECGNESLVTCNDKKPTGVVFDANNVNCEAIHVNGNNAD